MHLKKNKKLMDLETLNVCFDDLLIFRTGYKIF